LVPSPRPNTSLSFAFLEVHREQALAVFVQVDWLTAVRIDHTALVTATAGDVISVPPKRSELGAVSPDDKN
jgi:hypothetical protein